MRICIYLRSLHTGGAERQISLLAPALRAHGVDVTVVTDYPGGGFADVIAASGVTVVSLEKRSRWRIAEPALRLRSLLREGRFDVLYSVMSTANLAAAALRPSLERTKLFWGVRGSDVRERPITRLQRVLLETEVLASSVPDGVIFNSERGMETALARGWHPRARFVVQNGFDAGAFAFDPSERARVRAEFRVNDGEKLVGIVARLFAVKEHETFVRAASILHRRGADSTFVIVGEGEGGSRARLESLASDLGVRSKLRFVGSRSDVSAVFSALDVCCLSSISEGFPNVLAEAMLCGVPCVSTDVGDAREILGPFGALVPPRVETAFADAVERVAASNWDRHALRSRITENFSVPRLAASTLAAFEAVMSGRV